MSLICNHPWLRGPRWLNISGGAEVPLCSHVEARWVCGVAFCFFNCFFGSTGREPTDFCHLPASNSGHQEWRATRHHRVVSKTSFLSASEVAFAICGRFSSWNVILRTATVFKSALSPRSRMFSHVIHYEVLLSECLLSLLLLTWKTGNKLTCQSKCFKLRPGFVREMRVVLRKAALLLVLSHQRPGHLARQPDTHVYKELWTTIQ